MLSADWAAWNAASLDASVGRIGRMWTVSPSPSTTSLDHGSGPAIAAMMPRLRRRPDARGRCHASGPAASHTVVVARIALVLGAGGSVGHAFHAGVLGALGEHLGWNAGDADVLVGTSAGSVVSALLRAGLSSADLARRARRVPLSSAGQEVV